MDNEETKASKGELEPASQATKTSVKLTCLKEGESGYIVRLGLEGSSDKGVARIPNELIVKRLFELGFTLNSKITVSHKSAWGGSPLAVSIAGSLIGLNRQEAELIEVERSNS